MRRHHASSSRALRSALVCVASLTAAGTGVAAASVASAATARPATSATLGCIAEATGHGSGTVDCFDNITSGTAPFTVSWSQTGGIVVYSDDSELLVACGTGSVVKVTVTITDSTGASTQAHSQRSCVTGTPR